MTPIAMELFRALAMFPMTLGQIEALIGRDVVSSALRTLDRRGLLTVTTFDVGTIARVEVEPLFSTASGKIVTATDIAKQTRDRYGSSQVRTDVFSVGEVGKPGQLQHELGLASVYVTLRRRRPDWTIEIPRRGQSVLDFDLVAMAPSGLRVGIEYAGEYRSERIRELLSTHLDGMHLELY